MSSGDPSVQADVVPGSCPKRASLPVAWEDKRLDTTRHGCSKSTTDEGYSYRRFTCWKCSGPGLNLRQLLAGEDNQSQQEQPQPRNFESVAVEMITCISNARPMCILASPQATQVFGKMGFIPQSVFHPLHDLVTEGNCHTIVLGGCKNAQKRWSGRVGGIASPVQCLKWGWCLSHLSNRYTSWVSNKTGCN